jgi:hypothetical protein
VHSSADDLTGAAAELLYDASLGLGLLKAILGDTLLQHLCGRLQAPQTFCGSREVAGMALAQLTVGSVIASSRHCGLFMFYPQHGMGRW